jgi:hypothetical protein
MVQLLQVNRKQNETDIDLKFPGGASKQLKQATLRMKEIKQSMMPENLYRT